jgi:hypothetical protein
MMNTLTSMASLTPRGSGAEKDNNNPAREKCGDDENAKFSV